MCPKGSAGLYRRSDCATGLPLRQCLTADTATALPWVRPLVPQTVRLPAATTELAHTGRRRMSCRAGVRHAGKDSSTAHGRNLVRDAESANLLEKWMNLGAVG